MRRSNEHGQVTATDKRESGSGAPVCACVRVCGRAGVASGRTTSGCRARSLCRQAGMRTPWSRTCRTCTRSPRCPGSGSLAERQPRAPALAQACQQRRWPSTAPPGRPAAWRIALGFLDLCWEFGTWTSGPSSRRAARTEAGAGERGSELSLVLRDGGQTVARWPMACMGRPGERSIETLSTRSCSPAAALAAGGGHLRAETKQRLEGRPRALQTRSCDFTAH